MVQAKLYTPFRQSQWMLIFMEYNIMTKGQVNLTNPTTFTNSSTFYKHFLPTYMGVLDAINGYIYLAEGNRLKVGKVGGGKNSFGKPH